MDSSTGKATLYLLQEVSHGRYRIAEISRYMSLRKDWMTIGDGNSCKAYTAIRQMHLLLPEIIPIKRVGQMVNPTKLLKQHLALQKEQSNESTKYYQASNSNWATSR